MSTRETIDHYFKALESRGAWQDAFSEDVRFTSFISPVREMNGRDAFVEGTKRFYGSIESVEVRELLVDGDRAVALTRYVIRRLGDKPGFRSDVAEVFRVRDSRIVSFGIYFDTAPYPK